MTSRLTTAQLVDRMTDAAINARSPKARRFAEDMCCKSLRSGWRPTPGQRRYMDFIAMDLSTEEDEAFDA